MVDRMDPDTRKAVTAAGGRGRAAALSPAQRSDVARAGASATNAPVSLARRIVKAWPDLAEEDRAEVLGILTTGLPLTRKRRP